MNKETENFIKKLKEEYELISVGSSIKLCLIAEGSADIYPRFAPTMEWDTAAGHAILRGIGKEIYQINGKVLEYNKKDLLNPSFIVR
jgi:3'(2'), 5'-bisphosphate nucleotidase